MTRSDSEIAVFIVLSGSTRVEKKVFYKAIELPNTHIELDVDSERTIIGISREDSEIYRAIFSEILSRVHQYEISLVSGGRGKVLNCE